MFGGDGGESLIGTEIQNYQDRRKKVPEFMHAPALAELHGIRDTSSISRGDSRMNPAGRKLQMLASPGPGGYITAVSNPV